MVSEWRDSSCRLSNAQPVFSALKNSSMVHRARCQSTTCKISSAVSIDSDVSSVHLTPVSPAGGFSSATCTTCSEMLVGNSSQASQCTRVALPKLWLPESSAPHRARDAADGLSAASLRSGCFPGDLAAPSDGLATAPQPKPCSSASLSPLRPGRTSTARNR